MTAALTGLVVTSTLSLVLEAKLLPRLARELRVPVGVYGVILTGTVAGAVAWYATGAPPESRRLVLAGALLLYLGDAFYAYHRFVSRVRYGQSFGLLLYWAGQLALVLGVRGA